MRIRLALLFPALLMLLVCIGLACSGGAAGPTVPGEGGENAVPLIQPRETSDIYAGGLWEVAIDKYTGEAHVTDMRTADKALNVLSMLEPPTLFFLSINLATLELDPEAGYVGVNVILNHPIYSPMGQYKGFDVRGIVFGPYIENADGYTPLLRPRDFAGMPFGYVDGMLGAPAYWSGFNNDVYPYKYFADNLAAEESLDDFFTDPVNMAQRGKFSEGSTNVRHYDMYFDVDAGKFLIFNYAVLVSYDFPKGDPPYELGDYSIQTANCAEPFNIDVDILHNSLFYDPLIGGGGTISLTAEVYDWQGLADDSVSLSSSGVIPLTTQETYTPGSTGKSGVFSFIGIEGIPQGTGEINLVVTAYDMSKTFGETFFMGFMPTGHVLYNKPVYTSTILRVEVNDKPAPWVGAVEGDNIFGINESTHFSVEYASDLYPSGPFTFAWEKGDDIPPAYDDGEGDSAGGIDLTYTQTGFYTVDCKVIDPGGNSGTSILPLHVIAAQIPWTVTNLTLRVNRYSDSSIRPTNNITLEWEAVPNAAQYAVYYDSTPMAGDYNTSALAGVTTDHRLDFTLSEDGAAIFVVKGRGLSGFPETEGSPSNYAFVDLEQAEVEGSEGSWEGNSIYDSPDLKMERTTNYAQKIGGLKGWFDGLGATSQYKDSYEVFYSDAYPEIPGAQTFLFEVPHRVTDYNYSSDKEDGYGMGYLAHTNPVPGLGSANFLYFIVLNPISGPTYWSSNDAMTDEFTYSGNPDSGYTYSYYWRFSTFNVNYLQYEMYDRVAIGHATDTDPLATGSLAVDDIAVIIY